ncbi:MAG: hypothetical protein ACUVQ2_05210 [Dissulfurimicrobium sp.]|uniref:hypothetical protein n=1 Tax=Dissulfurimicrobium sp. TaxID=2022436 RepID=UPI004049DA09
MKDLKNEKGVALITALLLAVIGLLMVGGLFMMLKGGIWSSGSQKRYKTALEASYGVLDIVTRDVIPKAIGNTATSLSSLGNYSGLLKARTTDACFTDKLTKSNTGANWSADCILNSLLIPTANADMVFHFQFPEPQSAIDVFAKIVDTVPGNSSTSGVQLEGQGVASSGSGVVPPQHLPYMYRIEIQGQNTVNPMENAQLSVLYAY